MNAAGTRRGGPDRPSGPDASLACSETGQGGAERLGARPRRAGRRALKLYLDASALVKRYVAEPGSELVREAMGEAEGWHTCRAGYVETVRAVGLAAGARATKAVREEWPALGVIEIDQALAEHAAALALDHGLGSLDALHLAAALLVTSGDLTMATWDQPLHDAGRAEGLDLLPAALP